jgi:hypothetical protein
LTRARTQANEGSDGRSVCVSGTGEQRPASLRARVSSSSSSATCARTFLSFLSFFFSLRSRSRSAASAAVGAAACGGAGATGATSGAPLSLCDAPISTYMH